MKLIKVILFLGLVFYWVGTMDNNIRGEGIYGSFLGIIVLIVFIYGAYNIFFEDKKSKDN